MNKIIIYMCLLGGLFSAKANDLLEVESDCIWKNTEFEYFCDTCGCGGNGGSMGFGTGLNNNFVGLRYIGQKYRSRDGIFDNSPWVNENFNTVQAWGKFPVSKRVLLNALLPYHFHNRTFADNTEQRIEGVGDATVLAYYLLLSQTPDSLVSIGAEHTLQIGGGVKVPTGSFDAANIEGTVNPSFQLGTGSWDYLFATNYGVVHRNWGLSASVNYTLKTENSTNYQFGNQWNLTLNTYKTYYVSNTISLTPQVGLGSEIFSENKEFGLKVSDTGGEVYFARLGFETNYKRYSFGISSMLPISQNLNNGKVEVKNRVSLYLNINI
ncbi:transporter [Maribacter sp. MAR_2009_72]|uniref:transporter n=1 Tax=Maribacter sp. MAR_2009_72 TaxID=1250050 RepID=UPI00119D3133|nr:transporter [Maribacter sp. MAR_2009_72]